MNSDDKLVVIVLGMCLATMLGVCALIAYSPTYSDSCTPTQQESSQ